MYRALSQFERSIEETKMLSDLYDYVTKTLTVPMSFKDILRSQIVYSVSAFDKLIHDLVRIGMVEIFIGRRQPTQKYLSENISLDLYQKILSTTIPPKEFLFEQEMFKKLKTVAYQDPSKIADGLSYIWSETHKWQKISSLMSMNEDTVKTTLKGICDRRNKIVHESDVDPFSGLKYDIEKEESESAVNFLLLCGKTISGLVS